MTRFAPLLAFLALAVASPAAAQQRLPVGPDGWIEAPQRVPRSGIVDTDKVLDTLFQQLKQAPDSRAAQGIEARIWSVFMVSGSDTADLLMARAQAMIVAKQYDEAIELLDAVILVAPDFAEAWNRRASVFFLLKDHGRALTDLRETLKRNPRHFAAMAGMGVILQELGDERRAIAAFRAAVEIHPHLAEVGEMLGKLEPKVRGREI